MQLKWPLLLLLLVPILAALVWRLRRPAQRQTRYIAEAASVTKLPSYTKVTRRAQILQLAETAVLGLLMATLVIIASRPQATIQKVDYNNSRDVVLCVDASNSMTPYIPDALLATSKIVETNPTDRYSLVLFQNVPYVALPLTSDITAIKAKLQELAAQYKGDTFGPAQLAGFQPGNENGTDIGAGLAGCVRRFDHLDQPHTRHIIMVSDMENNGSTDETKVAELVPKYGIHLHIMAPESYLGSSLQDDPVTQITGAKVYQLRDASSVQTIVNQIFATILNKQRTVQFAMVDAPYPWWLAASALTAAWAVVALLRWRWRT